MMEDTASNTNTLVMITHGIISSTKKRTPGDKVRLPGSARSAPRRNLHGAFRRLIRFYSTESFAPFSKPIY